jgi:hypothetical protein
VDFHMVQVPVHFHRRMKVLMAVAIARTDLTSREFRAAGSRSHDARAARRMVAVALVPESADRKSAAASCGMDRRPLRDWLHRYDEGGLEGLAGRRGVTPLLDGARALRVPDNITLMPLPPHTPQINPVENVRACLRANKTAISVFNSYHDIVDRYCKAWNVFANNPATVRSITTRDYTNRINI